MGYALELFAHSQKIRREACLLKGIFGPWSCVKCKYLNFWGNSVCNNCAHEWETPNKRLVEDKMSELQPATDEYWATFFDHPLHVEGHSWASQIQIDLANDPVRRKYLAA